MKKNKAYDLAAYPFSRGETFLLDANVWLYLYPPPSGNRSTITQKYSSGFKVHSIRRFKVDHGRYGLK